MPHAALPLAPRTTSALVLASVALAACGGGTARSARGTTACGITALAGATLLLDQFQVPRQTLSVPPADAPATVAVRVAAGPAYRGRIGLEGGGWAVTVDPGDAPLPGGPPGFGVVVAGPDGRTRGVVLFTGTPVQGAPVVGRVRWAGFEAPLLGLQTEVAGLESPDCPFFPNSVRRP